MMKRQNLNLIINSGLLILGSAMVFSGLTIQFSYHMGNHGEIDTNHIVLGFNYLGWSGIHKIVILFISMFMIFHIALHWKWYTTLIRKTRMARNKQLTTLTIVFILVAVTGYVPWFIDLADGPDLSRKIIIEFHDKLTLVLFVFLVLHVAKRLKWYVTAFGKLNKTRAG